MDLNKLSKSDAMLIQHGLKALGFYHGTTRGVPASKTQAAYDAYRAISSETSITKFSDLLATIAEGEVGTLEKGNNGGERIREYQSATWYAPGPWPWCAAFVCWCYQQALKTQPIGTERPTTPGAWDFENWARKAGAELIKPVGRKKICRGDIVIYTFSHIGIAVADEKNSRIRTVEGNTNGEGSREGDGVYRKIRKKSQIRSIIRL